MTTEPTTTTREVDPRRSGQSPAFLRAFLVWILGVTVLVTLAALLFTLLQTPVYTSRVNVLVEPRVFPSGGPAQAPDMGSEKEVATSGAVISYTAKHLNLPPSQIDQLRRHLTVTVPVDTHVLVIAYRDPDPRRAQQRAAGFAQGYLQYIADRNRKAIQEAARTGNRATLGIQSAEIITPATLPESPSSPHVPLNIAVGIVAGLSLGLGTALLRDRFGNRLTGPADLEARTESPVLAIVPGASAAEWDEKSLTMLARPDSAGANAYRRLRQKVQQSAEKRAAKTLVVTSSTDQEGKTTVAANLAVALAHSGEHVILVEGDFQRPRLHQVFAMDNDIGLTTILDRRVQLDATIRQTAVPRVYLLASGSVEHEAPVQLSRANLNRVVEQLREYLAIVIIDAPPVLAASETAALIELSDMVLLVEDVQRSTRRQVDAAVAELDPVREKIVGGVLITKRRWQPGRGRRPPHDGVAVAPDAPVAERVLRVADVRPKELEA